MHTKNLSIKIESDSGNNNINFMNKDAVPLDTRVGSEYDNIESSSLSFPCLTRESRNKDTMSLDTREGSEYDNIESSSLSFPCLTRESRNEESDSMNKDINSDWIFGSSPNMTGGNNNSNMTEGNNALSIISQSGHIPPSVTLGRSETKTRGSRNKDTDSMNNDIMLTGYSCQSTNMTRMISQSGRSMVEMLGVLAVIGVLSIGGIAGYSYGMDKYRANETTNQIMLRAIDLMTQAANENETLSLSAWNNETAQYDFGEVGFTHDDLIYMDVGTQNKLPKRVCEIVYDALKDMAVQIDINATRADSNDTCGDDNEMTFYFEGTNNYTCDPACPEGQYCDNGICFKGTKPEGTSLFGDACSSDADCNVGWTGTCAQCSSEGQCKMAGYDGDECTLTDGTAGQCNLGRCYPKGCTSNDDCKETGTYCASTNSSYLERFQSGETGSCAPIDFVRYEGNDGNAYYISNGSISWWDAEYACAAMNREMVEVYDLVTESNGSKWQGDTGYHTKTALANELYSYLGYYYIWTQNLTNDNKYAFGVSLDLGLVYGYYRYVDNLGGLAVCR